MTLAQRGRLWLAVSVSASLLAATSCSTSGANEVGAGRGMRGAIDISGGDYGAHHWRFAFAESSSSCTGDRCGKHRCAPATDGKSVLLVFAAEREGDAVIAVSPDAADRGVALQLPWSHTTLTKEDCTEFEASVSSGDSSTAGAGKADRRRGVLRLRCKLNGRGDTLDVDVEFEC